MPDNEIKTLLTAEDRTGDGFQRSGQQIKDYANKTKEAGEQVTHAHLNMRHALAIVASQSGMSTSELMHFYYAVTMLPGGMGVALGAFMMLRGAIESYREELIKARDEQHRFELSLQEHAEAVKGNGPGGEAGSKISELKRLKEDIKEKENQIEDMGEGDTTLWLSRHTPDFMKDADDEKLARLDKNIAGMKALEPLLKEQVALYRGIQEQQRMLAHTANKAEIERGAALTPAAEAANLNTRIKDALEQKKLAESNLNLPSAKKLDKEAYGKLEEDADKRSLEYAKLVNEEKKKGYEAQKSHDEILRTPTARFVDPGDKLAELAEQHRMKDAEEVKKYGDQERAIKERAYLTDFQREQEINKAHDAWKVGHDQEQANYEKSKTELEYSQAQSRAHLMNAPGVNLDIYNRKAEIETNFNNKRLLEDEKYESERHNFTITHNGMSMAEDVELQHDHLRQLELFKNEELKATEHLATEDHIFQINANAEMLTLKGHTYEAEKTQLEAWFEQEKEAHKGQAEALATIEKEKAAKLSELERKHQQEKADQMESSHISMIRDTQGAGMAEMKKYMYDEREKIANLRREGKDDEANQEEQAAGVHLQRMAKEAKYKMMAQRTVGFTDASSAWESFSSGLNKNPEQKEQLEQQRALTAALDRVAQALGSGKSVIGVLDNQ